MCCSQKTFIPPIALLLLFQLLLFIFLLLFVVHYDGAIQALKLGTTLRYELTVVKTEADVPVGLLSPA